jgi:hypothetical protein
VSLTAAAVLSDKSPSGQRRLGPITMAMFPVVILVISWYCANSCRKASRYFRFALWDGGSCNRRSFIFCNVVLVSANWTEDMNSVYNS